MTLNRYAKQRDQNEPEIIEELERLGCIVWKLDRPVDLLVFDPESGRWTPIEVKMPKAHLTQSQREFFSVASEGAACVRSAAEARAWITELRRSHRDGTRNPSTVGGHVRG